MMRPMLMNLSRIVPVRRMLKISDATIHTMIKQSTPKKRLSVPVFFMVR